MVRPRCTACGSAFGSGESCSASCCRLSAEKASRSAASSTQAGLAVKIARRSPHSVSRKNTLGRALTSARNSSSTSRSRTMWAKPSRPARSRSLASASSVVCAMTRRLCLWASSMIAEAHKHNLRVMAHTTELADAKDLLRAGLDGFAHMVRDRDVDDEFLALVKARPNVFFLETLWGERRAIFTARPAWVDEAALRDAFTAESVQQLAEQLSPDPKAA